MDSSYSLLLDTLRKLELRLGEVIDGRGVGPERLFAMSGQSAAVHNSGGGPVFDRALFDDKGPTFDPVPVYDVLDDGPIFDEEQFVDPVFSTAPDSDHDEEPVFDAYTDDLDEEPAFDSYIDNLGGEPVFDTELVHDRVDAARVVFDDIPLFDDVPLFDAEPEIEEAELIPDQAIVIGAAVATPATCIDAPSTCSMICLHPAVNTDLVYSAKEAGPQYPLYVLFNTNLFSEDLRWIIPAQGDATAPKMGMRSFLSDSVVTDGFESKPWDPGASDGSRFARFGVDCGSCAEYHWDPGSLDYLHPNCPDCPHCLVINLLSQQKCGGCPNGNVLCHMLASGVFCDQLQYIASIISILQVVSSVADPLEAVGIDSFNASITQNHSFCEDERRIVELVSLQQDMDYQLFACAQMQDYVNYWSTAIIFKWGDQYETYWINCAAEILVPWNPEISEFFLVAMVLQCINCGMLIWVFSSVGGILPSGCVLKDFDGLVLVYDLLKFSVALFTVGRQSTSLVAGISDGDQTLNPMVTELCSFQGSMGVFAIAVTYRAVISDLHEVGLQGILSVRQWNLYSHSQEVPGHWWLILSQSALLVAHKMSGLPQLSISLVVQMVNGALVGRNSQWFNATWEIHDCQLFPELKMLLIQHFVVIPGQLGVNWPDAAINELVTFSCGVLSSDVYFTIEIMIMLDMEAELQLGNIVSLVEYIIGIYVISEQWVSTCLPRVQFALNWLTLISWGELRSFVGLTETGASHCGDRAVVVQEKQVITAIGMALGLIVQMVYTVSHFFFTQGLLRCVTRIPDSCKDNKINWLKSDCMPWEFSFSTIERTVSALLILWFRVVQQQIACLQAEILETIDHGDPTPSLVDGSNLSLKCLGELKAQLSWLQMEKNLRLDKIDTKIKCISDMCNMMSADLKKALYDVHPSYVQEKKLIGKYFEEISQDIALFAKQQEQPEAMQRTLKDEENYESTLLSVNLSSVPLETVAPVNNRMVPADWSKTMEAYGASTQNTQVSEHSSTDEDVHMAEQQDDGTTEDDSTQGFEGTSPERSEETFRSDLHGDPVATLPEREVTDCKFPRQRAKLVL